MLPAMLQVSCQQSFTSACNSLCKKSKKSIQDTDLGVFCACHRESEDELSNPIALYRSLATAQLVDYIFSLTLVLDAQKDDEPPTPTLLALWRLLGLDESSPTSEERGCRVWRFSFGCIPAALYVKGAQHLHPLIPSQSGSISYL